MLEATDMKAQGLRWEAACSKCTDIVRRGAYLEDILTQRKGCVKVQHPAEEDLDPNHEWRRQCEGFMRLAAQLGIV